jgi:hypothetical protein
MNATTQTHGSGVSHDLGHSDHVHLHDHDVELATADTRTVHHVLLELQREFGAFGKDASGYGYKYVTLGKILDQIRPVLVENNCIMTHTSNKVDDDWHLTTTIHHIPSNTVVSTYFVTVWSEMKGMSNPQTAGAYETYARRYNILKLLNCSVDDDDAADVYRQTMRDMNAATSKDQLKSILGAAKTQMPKTTWVELCEVGKEIAAKFEEVQDAEVSS